MLLQKAASQSASASTLTARSARELNSETHCRNKTLTAAALVAGPAIRRVCNAKERRPGKNRDADAVNCVERISLK